MPHAAPARDDTKEQLDSLHEGIVVELHRRLSDVGEERDVPFRFRKDPIGNIPARGDTRLSRSIEQALHKVASMQLFIRAHEETIYDLRQANAARDRQHLENRHLLDDRERRCREEAERANRAERLIELLEQRNTQLEKDYADLSCKVEGLLRAIDPA